MSILGKIGNWVSDRIGNGPSVSGLKSSIRGTGNLAAKAAPFVSFVNPVLGAALAAGGSLAGGKNIGESLVAGAKSYGGSKLLGAIPGAGKLASKIPGVDKIPGLPAPISFDAAGAVVPQASRSLGSSVMDGLKSVGSFALDNPDLIAGGIAGVSGFKAGQQSDDLRNQAIAAMSDRPDLSSVFAGGGAGNPYSKYAQKPKAAGRLAA